VNKLAANTTPTIPMGELAVAVNDGLLRTLLGSCIGLALYDQRRRVAGLAHIVLPQSRNADDPPAKYMDTAVPALCHAMERAAGGPVRPSARIAGGANMFATSVTETIGKQNLAAAERLLAEWKIPLVARHCGGEQGRRMSLDAASGVVIIEVVGCDPIEL
jgi:chemotaxis protein CheD